jgi:hypothetical protein
MSPEQMGFNPEEQLNNEEEKKEKEANVFEIDENTRKDIDDNLKKGFLERAKVVAEKGQVEKGTLQEIVKENVLFNFKDTNHKDILHILEYYGIEKDFLKNEKFIRLGKDRVNLKLIQGDVGGVYDVLNDLDIDEKYLETEEAKESAQKGIKNMLSLDKINEAIDIKNIFDINDVFMEKAVKEEIEIRLKDNLSVGAISLQKRFNISKDFMKEAVEKEVLSRLSSGNSLEGIAHFITNMEMDASFLINDKIKEAIGERIKNTVGSHGQENIPDIFKKV